VLACGAHLKNTVCIGSGDAAYLGPHVGDLETVETCRAFEHAVERMQRFLGVCPEVVAYDLHPGYFSTGYALSRPEPMKVGVQHHHAHVASAMAEHRLQGPVIGVAYDGTGYGTDGAAWGGEVLLADFDGFTRLATFRPVRLAGSDQAIREVWRIALALVDDAFDHPATPPDLPLFRAVAERDLNVVRRMLEAGVHSPPAHGVGRYFDGIGALVLGRLVSRFEGQVALEWNLAAEPGERLSYPYEIADGALAQLDLRPMLRRIVDELGAGAAARTISARFHNTLVRATADLVRRTARQVGRLPVVLTGGCFQNPWLAEGVRGALAPEFDVRLHAEVPPGDGGIALGQAVVADAWARKQC
jgi:hydrogenase maturation protein HypF